jgi:3-phosphoshikimate 1-carboxyvinyltransferase
VTVGPTDIPAMVDELPLLGLLATQAEGVSEVRGAGELRVKESDRIAVLVAGLRALGADVEELPDGFVVRGPSPLSGGEVDAAGDHRMAMVFAVAGLVASGPVRVRGMESVGDSFPGFLQALEGVR